MPTLSLPELTELPAPPSGKTGWPWTAASTELPRLTPGGNAWPRITVVTPSYNQAEYLEATIRSVLLQGYPNLEYIIVDGGSTDGSQEVIARYRPWFSQAIVEPDEGQYDAINKGFAVSTGDVLSWINSDDMFAPNAFWAVGGIFADLRAELQWITGVPSMWDRFGNGATVLPRPRLNRQLVRLGAYDGVTLNFLQQEGTFWSRELWERSGGHLDTTLSLAADYELWCRFADHASLYGVSAVLAGNRRHAEQQSQRAMHTYMYEMELCRLRRPWRAAERNWLARGIKRRVARLLYRWSRRENLVVYAPGELRWEIIA
jgi:glycosyltransferase involved in cell wall biosynthesis